MVKMSSLTVLGRETKSRLTPFLEKLESRRESAKSWRLQVVPNGISRAAPLTVRLLVEPFTDDFADLAVRDRW